MRILRYGAHALLVECADPDEVAALRAELLRRREQGLLPAFDDLVPAERTVLIDGLDDPAPLAGEIAGWELPDPAAAAGRLVRLDVRYDGPDLAEVARAWRMTPDEAAALHSGLEYRVAFCGFAPGFAYLTGLPPQYHLPRRPTPRTAVPAGSVAVAGPYTGVYPRSSPGGWHLIGTTGARLWDLSRSEPALLTPGTRVVFTPQGRG
jgi:KipI family sensor histidine kinase inhibitor